MRRDAPHRLLIGGIARIVDLRPDRARRRRGMSLRSLARVMMNGPG
jgi:hypothetical protein